MESIYILKIERLFVFLFFLLPFLKGFLLVFMFFFFLIIIIVCYNILVMRRFFFNKENRTENKIVLQADEFFHIKNVLRLVEGQKVICFCGDGNDYFCTIENFLKESVVCHIDEIKKSDKTPTVNLTLFQGSLKLDKFEFVVQKMAELGLATVIPFESAFSVAKIKDEKISRLQKIATEASKQCGRADVLQVEPVVSFKQLLTKIKDYDMVIFAYEKESQNTLKNLKIETAGNKIAFIVGSEGGFSEKEAQELIAKGVKSVSLGTRILRAETAPIVLGGMIMFLKNEI